MVFLDEPTSALDSATQRDLLSRLLELRRVEAAGFVLVSHGLLLLRGVAESVVVMGDGQVVEEGPTEKVFSKPAHETTRRLLRTSTLSDLRPAFAPGHAHIARRH